MASLTHTYLSKSVWVVIGVICFMFVIACLCSAYLRHLRNAIPLADEIAIEIAIEISIAIEAEIPDRFPIAIEV